MALAVFIFTVVIGILNGTDIVDFGKKVLLAHVHGGTLGWITVSVCAASLWLFTLNSAPTAGEARWARWLSIGAVVTVPCNGGVILFMVGLFWEVTVLKQIGTPIMGVSILIAIATYLMRVQASRSEASAMTSG
ncbi:MAG: hypothetical protein EXR43_03310 [Dehalococcoidia bacterium]|nr:hypothetical protein [Dehalococcoidia bacterium]